MLNDPLLNIGVSAMQTSAAYMQLHSALPNASGSNECTSARVACGWPAAANGDFGALTNKAFTGVAASGPVLYVGFWSAATAGIFYGYLPLSGDSTANAAGQFTVTSVSIPGTAT